MAVIACDGPGDRGGVRMILFVRLGPFAAKLPQ